MLIMHLRSDASDRCNRVYGLAFSAILIRIRGNMDLSSFVPMKLLQGQMENLCICMLKAFCLQWKCTYCIAISSIHTVYGSNITL